MLILELCKNWDRKIRAALLPEAQYSQIDYKKCLIEYVKNGIRWLDIGCGHHIIPSWLYDEEERLVKRSEIVVGVDFNFSSLRKHATITNLLRGDLTFLPFSDNEFDLVTANMVAEHLQNPMKQFREVYRVLKYDGVLIIHTPNVWGYKSIIARLIPEPLKPFFIYQFTGRGESDTFPTYYKVNTIRSIENVARLNGFNLESIRMLQGGPMALFLVFPPLYLLESLWIKLLLKSNLSNVRGNIIAVLRKK